MIRRLRGRGRRRECTRSGGGRCAWLMGAEMVGGVWFLVFFFVFLPLTFRWSDADILREKGVRIYTD